MRIPANTRFVLGALISLLGGPMVSAQSPVLTYQGRLTDGGVPAQGMYDLRFTIHGSTNSTDTMVAGSLTNSAVAVSDGFFTVTLDFGLDPFNGADRWLEIGIRTNGNSGPYTILSPRQAATPVPYSLVARIAASVNGANVTGAVSSAISAGTATNAPNGVQVASTNLATISAAGLMPAGNNKPNSFYNGQQQLTSIPDAALSSNIPRLNGHNAFTGSGNNFSDTLHVQNGWLDMGTTSRTLIGNGAGNAYLTGHVSFDSEDTLIGHYAGYSLPGGVNLFHTFVGSDAGGNVVSGAGSVAFGQKAFVNTTNAQSSVAIGSKAGSSVLDAHGDSFVGYGAGQFVNQTTVGFRTYIGYAAGEHANGDDNVFIGANSGPQSVSPSSNNVGIGDNALQNMTTGSGNT